MGISVARLPQPSQTAPKLFSEKRYPPPPTHTHIHTAVGVVSGGGTDFFSFRERSELENFGDFGCGNIDFFIQKTNFLVEKYMILIN